MDLPIKPSWLRIKVASVDDASDTMKKIKHRTLCTVCVEAHCPNQMACFEKGTATFMLLGPACTRRCRFCAVEKSTPTPPNPNEPDAIAEAVFELGLQYCVLTMVTRDDLPDGGAGHIRTTVETIRNRCADIRIELLISDLGGNWSALENILQTMPQVLNHNIETVKRLYPIIRPQAHYTRSLALLEKAAQKNMASAIKSGMMLGLGETRKEVLLTMDDLRKAGCQMLTLGQYLAPTKSHHPLFRYVHPDEFEDYRIEAFKRGFKGVASAPLVRSSYQAAELYSQRVAWQKNNRISIS